MNTIPKTETSDLISAMNHWAKTITKNGGIAAFTILEGAERLRELETQLNEVKVEAERMDNENDLNEQLHELIVAQLKKANQEIVDLIARAEKAEAKLEAMKEDSK